MLSEPPGGSNGSFGLSRPEETDTLASKTITTRLRQEEAVREEALPDLKKNTDGGSTQTEFENQRLKIKIKVKS